MLLKSNVTVCMLGEQPGMKIGLLAESGDGEPSVLLEEALQRLDVLPLDLERKRHERSLPRFQSLRRQALGRWSLADVLIDLDHVGQLGDRPRGTGDVLPG